MEIGKCFEKITQEAEERTVGNRMSVLSIHFMKDECRGIDLREQG